MIFSFVILHYKTADDTLKCIESILSLSGEKDIIVVDNASDNGSIEKIEDIYGGFTNVYIIKNSENLGFASGNNVGYQYARENLNADFIVVSNNDIVVDTKDFIEKVINAFEKEHYYIAGPDIVSLADGLHQSPMNAERKSVKQVEREIYRYYILYLINKLGIYDFLKKKKYQVGVKIQTKTPKMEYNVQLHGSFVIFSPNYVKKENYAFRPGTFLYMEEAILFNYCLKNNYGTIFLPEIRVYHKEDSATKSLFTLEKKKREFVFKNMIQSLKIYKNVLRM